MHSPAGPIEDDESSDQSTDALVRDADRSLREIDGAEATLRDLARSAYNYRLVLNEQINSPLDSWFQDGILVGDARTDNLLQADGSVSVEYACATLYNLSRPITLLQVLRQIVLRSVYRLLRSASVNFRQGDLLVSLVCYRGCIEQVGRMALLEKRLRGLGEPIGFESNMEFRFTALELLHKSLYATRVPWKDISSPELLMKALKKKELHYKPEDRRIDAGSETTMNGVDALNKRVRGSRVVYEVLCDCAHPNFGTLLLLSRTTDVITDEHGVCWKSSSFLGNDSNVFLGDAPWVTASTLDVVAKILNEFINTLLPEVLGLEAKLQKCVQVCCREIIRRNPSLLGRYAKCPCNSGKVLRRCCGEGVKHSHK